MYSPRSNLPSSSHLVTVTLRDSRELVDVTRSQAATMRMRHTALTLAEERAIDRTALRSHIKSTDSNVYWKPIASGECGPTVMQMSDVPYAVSHVAHTKRCYM